MPHPDSGRTTLRMPYAQLRALVVALIEEEEAEQAVAEFEAKPTTYRPIGPSRTSTLDDVIASLMRG